MDDRVVGHHICTDEDHPKEDPIPLTQVNRPEAYGALLLPPVSDGKISDDFFSFDDATLQ